MRRLACALLAATFALPAAADERVLAFNSTIHVDADGTLRVTESIAVWVEGRAIKRGILRDFPTDYRRRYGDRVRVPFDVGFVTRNGRPEAWTLERLTNGVRVRTSDGWWLLRASNTQAVLVARAEAMTGEAGLERLKAALADQLKASGLAAPDFSGEHAGH